MRKLRLLRGSAGRSNVEQRKNFLPRRKGSQLIGSLNRFAPNVESLTFVRYHTNPPKSIELIFSAMKDKERWLELCQQAAVEQDPKKLVALVTEINQLLQEKEERLKSQTGGPSALLGG